MTNVLRAGSEVFENLLDGGYEKGVLTTIYGPAGSGKTTACLLAAINATNEGKVLFIDTEGGFSPTRLSQITDESDKIMEKIIFLKPTNFEEQVKCFDKIQSLVNDKFSLIICDTITSLYRTERTGENKDLVKKLARQIGVLVEIARTKNIPVIATTQVYSDFDKEGVKLVGGDILIYSSKCLLELDNVATQIRKASLKKHRHVPSKEVKYKIVEKGFEVIETSP